MLHHLIPRERERMASQMGQTACSSPRVPFSTRKQQDCRDSRDSLGSGTVLSETIATVSLDCRNGLTIVFWFALNNVFHVYDTKNFDRLHLHTINSSIGL